MLAYKKNLVILFTWLYLTLCLQSKIHTSFTSYILTSYFPFILSPRPTLKNGLFSITRIAKKKLTQAAGKSFFTLFKLNITFYFKCYLHHNCSVNLNWNNTQLYSSAKLLCNVPSSVIWFVNFCFLPFLHRTSVQKWKKNRFCYRKKWIGKKEMSTKITKYIASAKISERQVSISLFSL